MSSDYQQVDCACCGTMERKEAMEKHFVTFFSPGTMFAEHTTQPIPSWDVQKAQEMADGITERYNARPYAFQFETRSRQDDELDSRVTKSSPLYYLGGIVETLNEIASRNDPSESILLSNMRCNGWDRVVTCQTPYRWTQPLKPGDVVLPTAPAMKGKSHE